VGTRSVLGVPALRQTFLDNVPAAQPRQSQTHDGAGLVTNSDNTREPLTTRYRLDDDIEDDVDEDDDEDDDIDGIKEGDDDDDDDDDEEDGDDEDEDEETWQVSDFASSR
jgi:hypothetical protein